MPSEPLWLPSGEVVELNRQLVAETGEPHGVLKPEDLEAACYASRWMWEYGEQPDLITLAVRLLFGIARSHGFIQGNKRTGFVAAIMFLELNGWTIDDQLDGPLFGAMIVEVLTGRSSEAEFVRRLGAHIVPAAV